MVNYDDVLHEINSFGRFQKIRYGLICLAGFLPPVIAYYHSFIASNPDHRCTLPELENDAFSVNTSQYLNQSLSLEKCFYTLNGTRQKCSQWVFDKTYYQSTLTEEWSMVCDKAFLRSNVQSIYFFGLLIGSFALGILSDKFGRKPIVLFSFLLIILGGCGVALGPQRSFGPWISYIIYAISRFIIAIGTRGINLTAYVLGIELLDSKRKTFAGMVFQFSFPAGQILLAAMAYFIRDWRTFAWVVFIPTIPFLAYFFILPESPRWLLMKNKKEKALDILKEVAKVNKTNLDEDLWSQFLETESKKEEKKEEYLYSVFKSPSLTLVIGIFLIHWVVNNFIFYGVGLKSNDLGMNPYLTFLISAFVELLGVISGALLVDKLGRKVTYGASLFISGAACFSITFIDNNILVVVMATVGKYFVGCSYALIYLYSSETFPTSVRNSCLGACSTMARVGSIVAPLINSLGDMGWKNLPFMIFGICGLVTGVSTLLLPETLGRALPNTISEADRYSVSQCCRKKNNDLELEENKQ